MKTGDIVHVHDGSWCLFYDGTGEVAHYCGTALRGRRFRVLLTGVTLPADNDDNPDIRNDTMLCCEEAPEEILFTQAVHCTLISRPNKVPDEMEILIPSGTKPVVLRMLEVHMDNISPRTG